MTRKLESSKATAKHIKQHISNMQGAAMYCYFGTIVLAYHPRRKKAVRNQIPVKALSHSNLSSRNHQTTYLMTEIQISVLDVMIPHMHKDLTAQLRSTNADIAQKSDTSQRYALPKMHTPQPQHYHKGKPKQAHQIIVPEHSSKQYQNTHK